MVTKDDVMLIHDVAIKVRKKLDSIEKDEEFYQVAHGRSQHWVLQQ